MFHFPASTPTQTMNSPAGNTTQPVLGFPIRTSSDQRFVGNSPRHNAASHVLHRLSMPRHPPYARNKTHGHTNKQVQTPKHKKERYSRPLYSSHTTQPHTQPTTNTAAVYAGPNRNNQCCPRHPTVHQRKTLLSRDLVYPPTPTPRSTHPNQAPPSPPSSMTRRPAGMPPPGKNKNSGSHTLGDSTTFAHNCGHTK